MSALKDLIPVVNKLQDIVTNTNLADLDLPILTIIGSQSSGKSSVLENIIGKDFLPRGTGIVTRRPLILQLINIEEDDQLIYKSPPPVSNSELTLEEHLKRASGDDAPPSEWGEFLHIPGKRFYNFDEIRKEIENETARVAGKNKGISRIPINLKVYSPKALNLTMVDLPGLTKIPIGDQPTDIERQIKNLILEYIAKPNSIILAVSPANVDLVNSESLKLARQVDPQGKRTVGILTKLDLMDQGTNAYDILAGKVYPLKLGFIGIVNRSQQDISTNKSLDDSLQAEEDFFRSHAAYRNLSSKCGTRYLAKTLNQTLMNHIRDRLPDIKAKLNTLMGQTEQELASYGDMGIVSEENRSSLILQLMNKFANSFINSIDGNSMEISTKELCGGARIYYIYNEVFGNSLLSLNPTANLSVHDVRTAIRNSTGPRPSLFVPELAFDLLVKPQIKLLEGPAHRCVELVYEELMKICHNCGSQELARYPKLQTKLIEVVSELLRERLGPTTKYVESLIEIHRAYINTNHPNFVGAAAAMASVVEERQKERDAETNRKSIEESRRSQQEQVDGQANGSAISEPASENGFSDKKHKVGKHSESQDDVKRGPADKDSFLNFFFGKDESQVTQQQELIQRRAQQHPFQLPLQSDGLQFNTPQSLGNLSQQLEEITIEEKVPALSEREQLECELIRRLIVSYFGIVREMIQDQVPKAIMCLLVNYSKESVQNCLVAKLYKDSLFDELLYEDESLAQEREKCKTLLETYRDAAAVISEVI
ncbi:unnamed protein product [Kuraishia capsulata CBS 1993]|uniref:dynamin GTPase n=1 Tax=Kuraishia capsulata CBS 1993 TaxID=1382522 RepID=W6MUK0_9ASCO|nr:uncharacterized protein KUCA_T00001665001 [Kuraishia capsulata CBS 1993]CDK25695.1 unnamed protein product [Kuraishia capsulata CBS 1993]